MVKLTDEKRHKARIEYSPTGVLSVALDDQPVLSRNVSLGSLLSLSAGRAWIGWTAGVATGSANHDVLRTMVVNSEPMNVVHGPPTPEPSSMVLVVVGILMLAARASVIRWWQDRRSIA